MNYEQSTLQLQYQTDEYDPIRWQHFHQSHNLPAFDELWIMQLQPSLKKPRLQTTICSSCTTQQKHEKSGEIWYFKNFNSLFWVFANKGWNSSMYMQEICNHKTRSTRPSQPWCCQTVSLSTTLLAAGVPTGDHSHSLQSTAASIHRMRLHSGPNIKGNENILNGSQSAWTRLCTSVIVWHLLVWLWATTSDIRALCECH